MASEFKGSNVQGSEVRGGLSGEKLLMRRLCSSELRG
jgi:hypothetical protein